MTLPHRKSGAVIRYYSRFSHRNLSGLGSFGWHTTSSVAANNVCMLNVAISSGFVIVNAVCRLPREHDCLMTGPRSANEIGLVELHME